ncbi:hypothetical protein [Dulcicalothrix desertica]|uniref:hypothetical protein n=1 Tax=Dulcicalothrix desertica TaxID=32056 RepID=UPI0013154054|nr:hypothetical protein [Dulcicalothrix desertica]
MSRSPVSNPGARCEITYPLHPRIIRCQYYCDRYHSLIGASYFCQSEKVGEKVGFTESC